MTCRRDVRTFMPYKDKEEKFPQPDTVHFISFECHIPTDHIKGMAPGCAFIGSLRWPHCLVISICLSPSLIQPYLSASQVTQLPICRVWHLDGTLSLSWRQSSSSIVWFPVRYTGHQIDAVKTHRRFHHLGDDSEVWMFFIKLSGTVLP